MHHKDIKDKIRKQLKIEYPNWKRLSRKKKKAATSAWIIRRIEPLSDCR
jgi:hypothetical protein